MTPDEEQRRKLQQAFAAQVAGRQYLGGGQQAPQMSANLIGKNSLSPEVLALANKDYTGQQAQLDSQRDYGRALMESPGATGIQAGNVYVGPTWSASLASAIRKGRGGYELGKARKGQRELNAGMEESARAQAAQQQAEAQRAAAQQDAEAQRVAAQQAIENEQKEREIGIKSRDAGTRASALEQTIKKNKTDARVSAAGVEPVEFSDKTDQGRPPLVGLYDADAETFLVTQGDLKGQPVPGGYGRVPKTSGSYSSSSVKSPQRYVDEEGNETWIGMRSDGVFIDVDNQKPMSRNELKEKGLRQEDPLNANQMNAAISKHHENKTNDKALADDIAAAEATWKKHGWDGEDTPFNWFTKQSNMLGGAVRTMGDVVTPGGAPYGDTFAAAKTVMNTIGRIRAGLSQTQAELENIKAETGMDVLSHPEVFMQYWGRLKGKIKEDLATRDATLSPTVRREMRRRKASSGSGGEDQKKRADNLIHLTDEQIESMDSSSLEALLNDEP